ncbi:MAG TPA: hypothetical protein VLF62_03895 [Candidatus Saccharimonadales bacterium]|nr:hypothetical protein [Candidatus Saccharimonadales bacterium]
MAAEQATAEFNQPPVTVGDVADAASLLYTRAAMVGTPDAFPGFNTTVADGHVYVQKELTPTRYIEVEVFQVDNTWYVSERVQRPTLEDEGFGGTVRDTVTYPLNSYEPTTRTTEIGVLSQSGLLINNHEDAAFGHPLDTNACVHVFNSLRAITGEQPIVIPRAKPAEKPSRFAGMVRTMRGRFGRMLGIGD